MSLSKNLIIKRFFTSPSSSSSLSLGIKLGSIDTLSRPHYLRPKSNIEAGLSKNELKDVSKINAIPGPKSGGTLQLAFSQTVNHRKSSMCSAIEKPDIPNRIARLVHSQRLSNKQDVRLRIQPSRQRLQNKAVLTTIRNKPEDRELPYKMYSLFKSIKVQFLHSAETIEEIPENFPLSVEVMFVGQSNVGKSTLINRLTPFSKNALVRYEYGTTRAINFYAVRKGLILVDVPGYGYSVVDEKTRAEWFKSLQILLHNRPSLKRVYVLVDAAKGIQKWDEMFMEYLDTTRVKYIIILTKCDSILPDKLIKSIYLSEKMVKNRRNAIKTVIPISKNQPKSLDLLRLDIINQCKNLSPKELVVTKI